VFSLEITTSVRLPEELHEKLRKESYEKKLSQNEIFILALERYFDKISEMKK
jgi:predicted DNA-binding protein